MSKTLHVLELICNVIYEVKRQTFLTFQRFQIVHNDVITLTSPLVMLVANVVYCVPHFGNRLFSSTNITCTENHRSNGDKFLEIINKIISSSIIFYFQTALVGVFGRKSDFSNLVLGIKNGFSYFQLVLIRALCRGLSRDGCLSSNF